MDSLYRHRQFGWVTLGAVVPGLGLALALVPLAHALVGVGLALAVVALVGALFSTLTVEVGTEAVLVHFTGGFIKRTIPLIEIRDQRCVRNPWYYGFGIHRYPGGWIWNVAGLDAVELVLASGQLFRIGTDEPLALSRAIAQAAPHAPVAAGALDAPRRGGVRSVLIAASLVLLAGGATFLLFSRQMRDPVVTLSAGAIAVDTPFYGERVALSDVTDLALVPCLPVVERRTNGFAAAGLLRGWFDVRGHGRTKLVVDSGASPFIRLQTHQGTVFLNFSDPERTRELYGQIVSERGAGPPPQ